MIDPQFEKRNVPDQPAATEQTNQPATPERGSVASDGSAEQSDPKILDVIFGEDGWYEIVKVPDGAYGRKYILRFKEFSEMIQNDLRTRRQG